MVIKIKKFWALLVGCRTISRMLKRNKNKVLFYIYGRGIGDVCIETAYLNDFVNKKKLNYYVIVREKLVKIVKQMGIDNIISIEDDTAQYIEDSMCSIYTKSFYYKKMRSKRLYILNPWFFLDEYTRRINGISASKIIKEVALGIQNNEYQKHVPKVSQSKGVQLMYPYVIINPYSNSMKLDLNIWKAAVNYLKGEGYYVYTNVTHAQQELSGTMRLDVSIEELFLLANQASYIISIRSGIIDYIISNVKNMIVVYDGLDFRNMYSLDEWEKELNLQQIVWNRNTDMSKQLVEAIKRVEEAKSNE